MARRYHVSFDTNELPGLIVAVGVELHRDIIRDPHKKVFRVDLKEHPLYRQLEAYVLTNPSDPKELV